MQSWMPEFRSLKLISLPGRHYHRVTRFTLLAERISDGKRLNAELYTGGSKDWRGLSGYSGGE